MGSVFAAFVATFGGLTSIHVIAPGVAVAAETGTISEEDEIESCSKRRVPRTDVLKRHR
jgi:hypothetical protein